ncbi:MAG: sensor histidine kinase [Syntrophales bacterium]
MKIALIAAFLIVAVIPLAGLVCIVETMGENLIKEKVSSHLHGLSEKSAEAISLFLIERENDIGMLSYTISEKGLVKEALKPYFERMKDHYQVYIDFHVVDERGKLVLSEKRTRATTDLLSQHNPSIHLSTAGTKASDIFLHNEQEAPIPAILLSTPVLNRKRREIGTLFALVDFGPVNQVLKKTVLERTGEVYLVNREGYFLSSSRFGVAILRDRIPKLPDSQDGPDDKIHELVDYRGKNVLRAYRRIADFNWYVIAEQDREEALAELFRFRKFMILYTAVTVLTVFLLAYGIATLIVRRMKMNEQREKELEFQVLQKEKLAALGLLSAGLAHELNTPLANALLYTQMIKEELEEDDKDLIRQRLTTIEEVVKQGSGIVRNLLEFTRHSQSGSKLADIPETLAKLLGLVAPHCESKGIRVKKSIEAGIPPVKAETGFVQEIMTNLVANAIDAMPQGGTLSLTAKHLPLLGKVRIDIGDTGPGIPQDMLGKIFDPFYTTKKQGEGMGLGLFVSYEMARKLGGSIRAISSQGDNPDMIRTVFTVELPVYAGDGIPEEA